MLDKAVRDILRPVEQGKTLIITVGNPLHQDDGVGPYIAKCLDGKLPPKIILWNAGNHPENAIAVAVKHQPAKTVILDAAFFGARPGKVKVIREEDIPTISLSTHRFPIPALSKLIAEDTDSKVFVLGVQPGEVSLGEGISRQVKEAADEIVKFLLKGI